MRFDFTNAATRHYKDAELLYSKKRLANADQLYGLAAECVLKSVIVGLCPTNEIDVNGDFIHPSNLRTTSLHKKHLAHTNQNRDLWHHCSGYFSGRLATHLTLPASNPFIDWDVAQRYHHDRCFTPPNVEQHRVGVKELRKFRDDIRTSMGI